MDFQEKKEVFEGSVSYGLGCGSVWLGWVCQATDFWQAAALFLGVIVVGIRAAHDALRLYRSIKNGGKSNGQ